MRNAVVELRAIVGVDSVVRLRVPVAVEAAPTLTVHHLTLGDTDVPLAPVHAAISVTAVAAGRKRLTADGAVADLAGIAGPDGDAFLLSDAGGPIQCRVAGVDVTDATKIDLARPLVRSPSVSVAAPGSLQFATYVGTIEGGAGKVGENVAKLRYTLLFDEKGGANATATARRIVGLLRVQSPPWPGTGLDTASLYTSFPEMAVAVPPSQVDWAPQIEAGLRDLQTRLARCRPDIALGDDLVGGEHLHDAHAYFVAAIHYQALDLERARELRAYGQELLERGCHHLETLGAADAIEDAPGRKPMTLGIDYASDSDADLFAFPDADSGGR